jgi:hypothetical protein
MYRLLTRISYGTVRNGHEVPTSVGVRPGKLLPKQLAKVRAQVT